MLIFIALGFGAGAIGLAYLCQFFGNTVLQLSVNVLFCIFYSGLGFKWKLFQLSIFGLLGGPLLGVISLGI